MACLTALSLTLLRSVLFGKLCRIKPLVFSFKPRSQEQYGLAKYTSHCSFAAIFSWYANSFPLSAVIESTSFLYGVSNLIVAAVTHAALFDVNQRPKLSTCQRPNLSSLATFSGTAFMVLKPVRVIAGFQDVAMMGNAIQ
jgi:hypothetical protein